MAIILSIETSEHICSVALSKDSEPIGSLEITDGKSHASMLTVLIEKLLLQKNISLNQLSAVAVNMGPGSYTGLRIGVSVSKGICYAMDIPLIALGSLQLLTVGILGAEQYKKLHLDASKIVFCPMIDARRMEVYQALYNQNLEIIDEIKAEILTESSYSTILEEKPVVFFGSGSNKFRDIVFHKNAYFIPDIYPNASYMVGLAYDSFCNKKFENTAYFEPFYLKDFVATVAKKKVLSF